MLTCRLVGRQLHWPKRSCLSGLNDLQLQHKATVQLYRDSVRKYRSR